ncbi:PREDICTED: uncharacterized protein LOC109214328 [Nicotiana attenuata]|uniref:Uncharacterized protein n=1 Tax=Nicotiana attenuata TaxID=49451 RepID=A0A1J6KEM1_NICAT|nr:PREDICTED: uncharacterized protein LOC109214328 [Nicotiana attenuata]OIT27156.1 hypothetical protein A4A49_25536 [Nicotiana attenuata]
MVSDGSNDRPQYLQDFLLIKDDDKFFSRLLSKENSNKGESSFKFYYYEGSCSSSIPFHWESEPGTPKHSFANTILNPPLTPPPSYQSISHLKSLQKVHSKRKFYHSIFSKRINHSPSIISPTSSCSSSFSMSSMPLFAYSNPTNLQSSRKGGTSPTSTHWFGSRTGNMKRFRVNYYYSMKKVKKLLLSFTRIRASRNIK